MVINKKVNGTASSIPAGISFGCGTSLLMDVAGAMIFAKLIDAEVLAENAIGYSAMAVLLVSSFAGARTAYAKIKRRKLLSCLICGGAYYCVLLAMTALIFGGQYQGMGVTALLVAVGSMCAVMLELPKGQQRGGRKRKIGYR